MVRFRRQLGLQSTQNLLTGHFSMEPVGEQYLSVGGRQVELATASQEILGASKAKLLKRDLLALHIPIFRADLPECCEALLDDHQRSNDQHCLVPGLLIAGYGI